MLYSVQTGCKERNIPVYCYIGCYKLERFFLWALYDQTGQIMFEITVSKLRSQNFAWSLFSLHLHMRTLVFNYQMQRNSRVIRVFNRGKIVHCCFSKCLLCFSSSIKFPRNEATSLKWKTCQWRRSCHLSHVASSSYHLQMLFTIFSLSLVMFTSSSDSISSICSEWSLFLSLLSIMSCYQWRKSRLEVCSWC